MAPRPKTQKTRSKYNVDVISKDDFNAIISPYISEKNDAIDTVSASSIKQETLSTVAMKRKEPKNPSLNIIIGCNKQKMSWFGSYTVLASPHILPPGALLLLISSSFPDQV